MKFGNNVILMVVIAIAIYAIFLFISDYQKLSEEITNSSSKIPVNPSPEKPVNPLRRENLWNRDTGGKPYNIINSGFHQTQPTGPQADLTRPRDRRMRHPSLIVHGLDHVKR